MIAPEILTQTVDNKGELARAISSPDFYVEVLWVVAAITISWLFVFLLHKRLSVYLLKYPLKRISQDFLLNCLHVLTPILAIIYLGMLLPWAQGSGGGAVIYLVAKLTEAYLLARIALIIIGSRPVAHFMATVILLLGALRATGYLETTLQYLKAITFGIGKVQITMLNLVYGLIILVAVFWLAGALSRGLESYLRRASGMSYSARELIVKLFKIFIYFTAFTITLSALGFDLTAFAVLGGALGVGIGLGLQKIMSNFFSGITLLLERSVKIGDMLEVGGVIGRVRSLNVRYALIETTDGRELMVPNEELTLTRVTNWTHSDNKARVDVVLGISTHSDPKLAQQLMLQSAREHLRCLKTPEPECFLREWSPQAFTFLLTFWVADIRDGRMGPQSEVMFSILEKFKSHKIELPKPIIP